MTAIMNPARLLAGALFAATLCTASLRAQGVDTLHVTIVANEGVLLHGAGGDILIDGAFGPGLADYTALAPALRADLQNARAPFDRVRLVLVTHAHRDHFNAQSTADLMRASGARLIAPPEVLDSIRRVAPDLVERVQAVLPDDGDILTIDVPEVARVHVLGLRHGQTRRPVEHIAFRVEVGGVRVLHVGDSEATPDQVRAVNPGVDLAIAPYWHLRGERADPRVAALAATFVLALHTSSDAAFGAAASGIESRFPHARARVTALERLRFVLPR